MIKCDTCPAAAVIREPDGTYTCGVCAMKRIKEGKGVTFNETLNGIHKQAGVSGRDRRWSDRQRK